MEENRGSGVEQNTKVLLLEWKNELLEAVTQTINNRLAEHEKTNDKIQTLKNDLVQKELTHLKDEQTRSFEYHKLHFEKIGKLETRQSNDEGKEDGEEKAISQSQMSIKMGLSLIAGFSTLVGLIAFFLGKGPG